MSFSIRQSRALDRRRRRLRFLKWILVIGVLCGLGLAAYESGSTLARRDVTRLEERVAALQDEVEQLKQQNSRLAGDAGAARLSERELQRRYDADVPTGEAKLLLEQVQKRLADGVTADRLGFMIDAATDTPACDGAPVTKRFIVRTPLTRGANDVAGFADRAITVSASGASTINQSGAPEAWYDPSQPVAIEFTLLGGKTLSVDGVLPLHKSVVHNGSEYRFVAVAGERRGFLEVTADRCAFPG